MATLKNWFTSRKLTGAIVALFGLTLAFFPEVASASDSWADVAESGAETMNAVKTLIVIGAYLAGTGLFMLGLWLIYKDGKEENRGHMKNGMIAMVIGALLLIFPTTVGWTVGSLGGDDSALEEDFDSEF